MTLSEPVYIVGTKRKHFVKMPSCLEIFKFFLNLIHIALTICKNIYRG